MWGVDTSKGDGDAASEGLVGMERVLPLLSNLPRLGLSRLVLDRGLATGGGNFELSATKCVLYLTRQHMRADSALEKAYVLDFFSSFKAAMLLCSAIKAASAPAVTSAAFRTWSW